MRRIGNLSTAATIAAMLAAVCSVAPGSVVHTPPTRKPDPKPKRRGKTQADIDALDKAEAKRRRKGYRCE